MVSLLTRQRGYPTWAWILGALLVGLVMTLSACGSKPTAIQVQQETPTATRVQRAAPAATRVNMTISADVKSMAIASIMQSSGVRDAAITQQGRDVSLVLIVGYAINETYAKQVGDNFVRMVKSLSQDTAPGKDIGKGTYNYLIGVYYPNEKAVVKGAKVSSARNINW